MGGQHQVIPTDLCLMFQTICITFLVSVSTSTKCVILYQSSDTKHFIAEFDVTCFLTLICLCCNTAPVFTP